MGLPGGGTLRPKIVSPGEPNRTRVYRHQHCVTNVSSSESRTKEMKPGEILFCPPTEPEAEKWAGVQSALLPLYAGQQQTAKTARQAMILAVWTIVGTFAGILYVVPTDIKVFHFEVLKYLI